MTLAGRLNQIIEEQHIDEMAEKLDRVFAEM